MFTHCYVLVTVSYEACTFTMYMYMYHTLVDPKYTRTHAYTVRYSYILVTSVHWPLEGDCTEVTMM